MVDDGTGVDSPRPKVAVLCRRWGEASEELWALRMVAGALASVADVTVLVARGRRPRRMDDGIFVVVELGCETAETTESDRLLEGLRYLATRETATPFVEQLSSPSGFRVAGEGQSIGRWESLGAVAPDLAPDLVVIGGFGEGEALRAAASRWAGVPIVAVPLVSSGDASILGGFAPALGEAALALVFSESERSAVAAVTEVPTRVLPLPIAPNPSVLRSAHEQVGEREYVTVIGEWGASLGPVASDQARLLVARFPETTFAVCTSERLTVFERGQVRSAEAAGRGSDLLRLMAWGALTIDLRPGPLFARRCLESLLYGVPILVPERSRAKEHAMAGRCGLWFEGAADLLDAAQALSSPPLRRELATRGVRYAQDRCRGTRPFVDAVLDAVGSVAPLVTAGPLA